MYIRVKLLHYCTNNDYLVDLSSTWAYILQINVLAVGETSGSSSSTHVFCDATPRRRVNCFRSFEEVRCLHLRGSAVGDYLSADTTRIPKALNLIPALPLRARMIWD